MSKPARRFPDLSPEPAPLVQLRQWNEFACRIARLHDLDMNNAAHHAEIARHMGWDLPVKKEPSHAR